MNVANSWLLFCKAHDSTMKQAIFKAEVAKGFCKVNAQKYSKKRRPLNDIE